MDFRALETPLLTGEVERRELAGREHLVAPVVLVREMVLNGGYLPADEIQESVVAWNGRPITVGHPKRDGEFAPANQPEFLESLTIGRIFDSEYVSDLPETDASSGNGVRGMAWVDEKRALNMGGDAARIAEFLAAHVDADSEVENQEDGEHVMDVSTGYWHDFDQREGTFRGQEYGEVQFNLHPDHLAFLPNQEGACSVADGCGVPRVQQALATQSEHYDSYDGMTNQLPNPALYKGGANARAEPRTPEFSGVESEPAWGDVDLSFEAFVEAYAEANPDATSVDDLSADEKSEIAARSLNGEPDASEFAELVVLPVVNPTTDNLNESGLMAALSRAPQTEGINAQESQSRVRSMLEEHFDRDVEDQVAASIGRGVMNALGGLGSVFGLGREDPADSVRADGGSRAGHGANCSCGKHETTNTPDMGDYNIEDLAEQSAFDADDLNEMEESMLAKVAETVEAAQADPGDTPDDPSNDSTGTDNDGTGDDTPDADDIESLIDQKVEERMAEQAREQRSDDIDAAVSALAEATDVDEDTLRSLADQVDDIDALVELAQNVAGEDAAKVGAANGVNWLGRGAPAGAAANEDEDDGDWEDFVSNIGVINRQQSEGDD